MLSVGTLILIVQGCDDRESPHPPNLKLATKTGTGVGTDTGTGGGAVADAGVCQCIARTNVSEECATCINDAAAGVCADEANIYGGDGPSELIRQCLVEANFAPDSIAECIAMTVDQDNFLNLWECACADCGTVCAQAEPATCDYVPTPANCGCIVDQITPGSACESCATLANDATCLDDFNACLADTTCDAIVTDCVPACEGSASLKACIATCLGASDSPSRALAEEYYQCTCFSCSADCSSEPACVPPVGTGGGGGTGGAGVGGSGGTGGV